MTSILSVNVLNKIQKYVFRLLVILYWPKTNKTVY